MVIVYVVKPDFRYIYPGKILEAYRYSPVLLVRFLLLMHADYIIENS